MSINLKSGMEFVDLLIFIGDIFGAHLVTIYEKGYYHVYYHTKTEYPYMHFSFNGVVEVCFEDNTIGMMMLK